MLFRSTNGTKKINRVRGYNSPRVYSQFGAQRWFDGKVYNLIVTAKQQSVANKFATSQRNAGHLARVVREQGIWVVYVRLGR